MALWKLLVIIFRLFYLSERKRTNIKVYYVKKFYHYTNEVQFCSDFVVLQLHAAMTWNLNSLQSQDYNEFVPKPLFNITLILMNNVKLMGIIMKIIGLHSLTIQMNFHNCLTK